MYCAFDKSLVPAMEISRDCFEIIAPPREMPGIVYFWLVCKDAVSAKFSTACPFLYTPVDDSGKLSLASINLANSAALLRLIHNFRHSVQELDLSDNALTDVTFIQDFYRLSSLILDRNRIHSKSSFPCLPKLKTLTVNSNKIDNLEQFVDLLCKSFPSLQYLSMLDNVACPFFHGQRHHYYNYRIYMISMLPLLTYLDSSAVTSEERKHAACIRIPDEPELRP